jgi:hypothetical protein
MDAWSKLRTFVPLFLTVAVSVLVALVGLCIVRQITPHDVLEANNNVAGNYLQTLGTIYGVLLAFVVIVVWGQYNDASKLVDREAHGLRDVVRLARAFEAPIRKRVLGAVTAYAQAVIELEWPAMQRREACPEASTRLREMWLVIEAIEPRGPREEALYGEAIKCFNDLGDARADRLQSSGMRLPLSLRIFVVVGGVCTVGSMYLFGLATFWPLAVMTGMLAGAVSHILYLIHDLDTPYGDWQVTPKPIELVKEKAARELKELETSTGELPPDRPSNEG